MNPPGINMKHLIINKDY